MDVIEAMRGRRATRAFLDKPIPRETVETILEAARFAPSGVNMQPWHVAVTTGHTKARITDALLAARARNEPENPDYRYYPDAWNEPYKSRRRASGLALYAALGIGKEDTTARTHAWNNNYRFFGAPVGLFFFIDRDLNQGSWVDIGMFIQNVMLAARHYGLDTCPQAALADYPHIVRELLNVPATRVLVCGMALGYADVSAPANGFQAEREPLRSFTQWYD